MCRGSCIRSPTLFAFVPMRTLAQNDDLLNLRDLLHEAEGEAAERMQQIARAAYAHTESNLYAINSEKPEPCGSMQQGPRPLPWNPRCPKSGSVKLSFSGRPLIESGKPTAKDRMMSDLKNRFVIFGICRFQRPGKICQPL